MNSLDRGLALYRAWRDQGLVSLDVTSIECSIISGEAGRSLYELMENYRVEEQLDGKAIAAFQRAMCGWLLQAGLELSVDDDFRKYPISLAPPTDTHMRRCLRVLGMVSELHKAGYQRLRIAAGIAPSGMFWRCFVTPSTNVARNGWEPLDWEFGARYTSGDEDSYFGWRDAPGKSARQLARLFIERLPELAAAGAGRDHSYAGWFSGMLGAAENGRLPVFYADSEPEPPECGMPPPPCGFRSQEPGDESEFIESEELTVEDLPEPDACWEDLVPFCLTFDGYQGGRRTVVDCVELADRVTKRDLRLASVDELRTVLFIRQRHAKWNSEVPVPDEYVRLAQRIVLELRRRIG